MPGVERLDSLRVLTQAREFETKLQLFLREEGGLTRTGFAGILLDLGTETARRIIVSTPTRGTTRYPLRVDDPVEFFFEIDGAGYAFPGTVRERVRYPLNDQRTVSAVRFDFPGDVLKIQRRSYYRAPAPPEPPITAKLRLVAEDETTEDRVFAADFPYTGHMLDLSGAGVALELLEPTGWEPEIDQLLTVSLALPDHEAHPIVLDARVRGLTPTEGTERTTLHLAWENCSEDDDTTGPLLGRIFRYVAERQRTLLQERGEWLRRR